MNNKVFISGKITGDRNYRSKFEQACMDVNRPKFFDKYGSAKLSYKYGFFGFQPVDPCDLTFLGHPLADCSWSLCMIVCLWHLAGCSYVYCLNDWKESRGARKENRVARMLGKKIIYQ